MKVQWQVTPAQDYCVFRPAATLPLFTISDSESLTLAIFAAGFGTPGYKPRLQPTILWPDRAREQKPFLVAPLLARTNLVRSAPPCCLMDRLFRIDFYPQDWILDTSKLTPEQRGIYIQLIALIYAHRGPIDNDPVWIARQSGCSPRLARSVIEQLIERGFVSISDGKITQKRTELEMNRKRAHLEASSKGGRRATEMNAVPNSLNNLASSDKDPALSSSSPPPSPKAKEKESSSPVGEGTKRLQTMADIWNESVGQKLPRIVKVEGARAKKMQRRLKDAFENDLERWRVLCQRISRSPPLLGETGSGWKAGIDWVLEPANLLKIMEGNYDPREGRNGNSGINTGSNQSQHRRGTGPNIDDITRDLQRRYGSGAGTTDGPQERSGWPGQGDEHSQLLLEDAAPVREEA